MAAWGGPLPLPAAPWLEAAPVCLADALPGQDNVWPAQTVSGVPTIDHLKALDTEQMRVVS